MSLHDGMPGFFEMLVGVLAGRRVAASDVSADEAFSKLHPSFSSLKAFGTAIGRRFDFGIGLFDVFAGRH